MLELCPKCKKELSKIPRLDIKYCIACGWEEKKEWNALTVEELHAILEQYEELTPLDMAWEVEAILKAKNS